MNIPGKLPATILSLIIMSVVFADCTKAPLIGGPITAERLEDGVYEGSYSSWPNSARVKVTVKEGTITDVVLIRHWASWVGKKAEPIIPLRIIEKQSANVDAVTGATNSSRVIMNAVQDALEKSYRHK
jgi:uncharacterized protein with FMN-binding domain